MNHIVKTEKLTDGRWRSSIEGLPGVFFTATTQMAAETRALRLLHALRSPNARIERVLPDGEVVLGISRRRAWAGGRSGFFQAEAVA